MLKTQFSGDAHALYSLAHLSTLRISWHPWLHLDFSSQPVLGCPHLDAWECLLTCSSFKDQLVLPMFTSVFSLPVNHVHCPHCSASKLWLMPFHGLQYSVQVFRKCQMRLVWFTFISMALSRGCHCHKFSMLSALLQQLVGFKINEDKKYEIYSENLGNSWWITQALKSTQYPGLNESSAPGT